MMVLRRFSAILFLLLLSTAAARPAEYDMGLDDNLITNPGFETADAKKPNLPVGWTFGIRGVPEGGVFWVSDTVHSGGKAVKLEAVKYVPPQSGTGGVSVSSDRFTAPAAGSTLQVSFWLRAKDVKQGDGGYFKLRFTVYAWDDKGGRIKHWDVVCTEGTFDWKQYTGSVVVPEGTKHMSVAVGLTACTGTAWVDGVEVRVVGRPVDKAGVMQKAAALSGPIVIPQPLKIRDGKEKLRLTELSVSVPGGDDIFKDALADWLKAQGISYRFAPPDDASGGLLLAGDGQSKAIAGRCAQVYPGTSWQDLGREGYFLSVTGRDGKPVIYMGANSEQGRFYALQSLKQLLVREGGRPLLLTGDILDKPVFARRGMAMGLQWFGKSGLAVERLSALKCNYVWNQGGFMGSIFGKDNWRQPLGEGHKRVLSAYLENCRRNFITPVISIAPRGNPPTQYSSDADINLVVEKMSELYEIGFRNFGLSFDDLQNIRQERLIVQADIDKFDNVMGRAHLYFVGQVYGRLKQKHSDISFSIVPMVYGGFINLQEDGRAYNNKEYLRQMSALPLEIEFVSCPYGMENVVEVTRLTKRPPLIWDNFFCTFERGGAPVFVPPFHWTAGLNEKNSKGCIFLPCIPSAEDAAGTSWLTAADYFWNGGDRQSQDRSYQAAMIRAAGGTENLGVLSEYTGFVSRFDDYKIPGRSREEQLRYLQESIAGLQQWQKKLVPVLPENLSRAVDKEIDKHLTNLELINKDTAARPFPIKVRRAAAKANGWPDGAAWKEADPLSGFMLVGGSPAQQQTTFKLLYDTENLYISATCLEPQPGGMTAKQRVQDSNVFQDDCVELFLAPRPDGGYYHLAVNSLGTVYDALLHDSKWSSGCKTAARVGTDSWTLEIAVPFKELGVSGVKPGDRWAFNLCRARYAEKAEFSSHALLVKGGFHSPSRFETLEFQ